MLHSEIMRLRCANALALAKRVRKELFQIRVDGFNAVLSKRLQHGFARKTLPGISHDLRDPRRNESATKIRRQLTHAIDFGYALNRHAAYSPLRYRRSAYAEEFGKLGIAQPEDALNRVEFSGANRRRLGCCPHCLIVTFCKPNCNLSVTLCGYRRLQPRDVSAQLLGFRLGQTRQRRTRR